MMIFEGKREEIGENEDKRKLSRGRCSVTVNGKTLKSFLVDPRADPNKTGRVYDWGYFGTYSVNLAYSILMEYFTAEGYKDIILDDYAIPFCHEYIVPLSQDEDWKIGQDEIEFFLRNIIDRENNNEN